MWILADGALYKFDDEEQFVKFDPGSWVGAMAIAPDGTIWVGHDELIHFNPASGAARTFTTAERLIHHRVKAIHVTPEGVVWIGTRGGVSRYVPE